MELKSRTGRPIKVGDTVTAPDGAKCVIEDITNSMVEVSHPEKRSTIRYSPVQLGLHVVKSTPDKERFDAARRKLFDYWKD